MPRRLLLHGVRVAMLVAITFLIAHAARGVPTPAADGDGLAIARIAFPDAESLQPFATDDETFRVRSAEDVLLGTVVRTMPRCESIVGFSGPSDLLIAFGPNDTITGVTILSSGDTEEHVAQVRESGVLSAALVGRSWEEAAKTESIDAVSGATLTATAMLRSIRLRLGGAAPRSSLFADVLPVDDRLTRLLPKAATLKPSVAKPLSRFAVLDAAGGPVGSLLRTSPAADGLIGYQGPTEAFVVFDADDAAIGLLVDESFDNEPYVGYLRDDKYGFLRAFNGTTVEQLAERPPADGSVDGVSGATMTSVAVADGITRAAREDIMPPPEPEQPVRSSFDWRRLDWGMATLIAAALLIGLTHLRSVRVIRFGFLFVLVGYLGFWRGDMVSQAMVVGWARNGVPWEAASGLVMLTAAALAVPVTSKRNLYCTHLCPHGAAQQLLANRLPVRRDSIRLRNFLKLFRSACVIVPPMLLATVLLSAFDVWPVALVGIEPFDAWHFGLAGGATLTVFVVGLAASLIEPMAYCRHGCPTGSILEYLRFNARSDHWTRRDTTAASLLGLSALLWWAT